MTTTRPPWLLNERQWEAVTSNDHHLLVLAGAGTGKTRVITYKIAYLVEHEGVAPFHILAVTFTNKAAGEMKERVAELLEHEAAGITIGTFHSFGLSILRRHAGLLGYEGRLTVYDDKDSVALIEQVMVELGIDKKVVPAKRFSWAIQRYKQKCQGVEAVMDDDKAHPETAKVYQEYQARLKACSAVDFGDLIYLPVELMRRQPLVRDEYRFRYRHLLVDEFQDTNHAQYELLRAMTGEHSTVVAVGDDDQSIYRWRGAEVANILSFPDEYEGTHVVKLEQNYRSKQNILGAASSLISFNTARHPKTLWSDKDPGPPVTLRKCTNGHGEAAFVVETIQANRDRYRLDEVAIFYRTHAQSRLFEEQLRLAGLPYRVYGGARFYDRLEVKDALAYLRLVLSANDDVSFLRVVNRPSRGVGKKTIEQVVSRARQRGSSLFAAAEDVALDGGRAGKALEGFVSLVRELQTRIEHEPATAIARAILEETGYLEMLEAEGSEEALARKENLQELVGAIDDFGRATFDYSLPAFIDHVSLVTDAEAADKGPAVKLMTVHSAKGLEFDLVFLTGLEESLFPHFNARSREDIEEERRLCYVAITRARERLFISHAAYRARYGFEEPKSPSSFIDEIDTSYLEVIDAVGPSTAGRLYGGPRRGRGFGRHRKAKSASAMPTGERVRHPTFGEGVVYARQGKGPSARVTVYFEKIGKVQVPERLLTFL